MSSINTKGGVGYKWKEIEAYPPLVRTDRLRAIEAVRRSRVALTQCCKSQRMLCIMKSTDAPPPIIVHSRADIAGQLAQARRDQGMTCEALDYRAGFSDRYVTKMENGGKPGMRQGFHISPMAEVWLSALGFALVLMRTAQAEEIGAVACPVHGVAQ